MNRRKFFKTGVGGTLAVAAIPALANGVSTQSSSLGNRESDQWLQVGNGKTGLPVRVKTLYFDVVVIGGGLAGTCAAVAAARTGAHTVLIQDRPVLGGNASSEIRVHVQGVSHLKGGLAERETGIIEEILLHNRFINPQESFTVWDHVIYDFVVREPRLELMLNTQAIDVNMNGDCIESAICWQSTTEMVYTLHAKQFLDCSGDGLLAAKAGAQYRTGREASSEFMETYAPKVADGWQMGASLVFQSEDMGKPMPFKAPSFTLKYDAEKSHPGRKISGFQYGIWWVEVGSDFDIIADQEINRHKLMGYMYGVWDYIKNSGKFPESENHALSWVGSVPGRRESRRFIGDYILSERDLTEHRHFDDAIAFGGWSLDEHNPGGIENLEDPPSFFHQFFDKVYEIPFRCLYSANIHNLLFAGRNISQTHIALSSTRVMATCALMGQAAGTAAAMCVRDSVTPRQLGETLIHELQENLIRDDVYIPNRPALDPQNLLKSASMAFSSSTSSGDVKLLLDGYSRDVGDTIHHWKSEGLPASVQFEWERAVRVSRIEIKCDSNVRRNIMMLKDSRNDANHTNRVPDELLRSLGVSLRVDGKWIEVAEKQENQRRLIKFEIEPIITTAIRIDLRETYGCPDVKLFEVRCYEA